MKRQEKEEGHHWQTKPAVLFNQSEQNMSDKFLLIFYKKKMSRFVASAAKFSEKTGKYILFSVANTALGGHVSM